MEEFLSDVDNGNVFSLGPIYGKQMRNWNGTDQLLNVINKLLDPKQRYSSELIISSWNVSDLNVIDFRADDALYQAYLDEVNWNVAEDSDIVIK